MTAEKLIALIWSRTISPFFCFLPAAFLIAVSGASFSSGLRVWVCRRDTTGGAKSVSGSLSRVICEREGLWERGIESLSFGRFASSCSHCIVSLDLSRRTTRLRGIWETRMGLRIGSSAGCVFARGLS
ncbi:hypothetical protein LshimejAT787_0704680 [Lyophyllum shimeji]|uniref:Uncharacterized protein n=1 Tax=Lyophyllum shimeji TaxID=47721 RepID=A0A9P3PQ21_LYOSH|nr:hypothetical protein LshimejAT787_0704680 [Lyophyllum shimeji]